ncbi:MAG: hypothetical protein ACTSUK_11405 [Promethearchaeota archaeon]
MFHLPDSKKDCPYCGKTLPNKNVRICPFCNKKLSLSQKPAPPSLFLHNSTIKENKSSNQKSKIPSGNFTPSKNFAPPIKLTSSKKKSSSEVSSARISFLKSLRIQKNPDIVASSIASTSVKKLTPAIVKNFQVKTSQIDSSIARVKISTKVTRLQVEQEKIQLGNADEYIKYIGIISKNREEIFSLNDTFTYLLDLAINLEYIATSILSGNLDRMLLKSPTSDEQEICYFAEENELILIIYGKIPEKKAQWLLQQINISVKDYFKNKPLDEFNKIAKYEISQKFQKKIKYLLETMIELNDVFTPKPLKMLSQEMRVDYFGLSYQSIGIISKLITTTLEFEDLPPRSEEDSKDFEDRMELQEAIITAKVEAIAANTLANTLMMPDWISVRLGFQQYRFIIFSRINDYYISLLAEGNLECRHEIFSILQPLLKSITEQPFIGVLTSYTEAIPKISRSLNNYNSRFSNL